MNPLNMMGSSNSEVDRSLIDVSFEDVAGCDEAKEELMEVVDFEESVKICRCRATIPRGILLEGPPGTGKTLLARAVAGGGSPIFEASDLNL